MDWYLAIYSIYQIPLLNSQVMQIWNHTDCFRYLIYPVNDAVHCHRSMIIQFAISFLESRGDAGKFGELMWSMSEVKCLKYRRDAVPRFRILSRI